MTDKLQKIARIEKIILDKNLALAFTQIKPLLKETHSDFYLKLFDEQYENYKFLLQYFIQNVNDPQRADFFNSISVKLLEINDFLRVYYKSKKFLSDAFYGWRVIVAELSDPAETFERNLADLDNLKRAFYAVVFANKLSKKLINKLSEFFVSDYPTEIKATIVSAITLSLLEFFDIAKFKILYDLYLAYEDTIWERAIVGVVIAIFFYNKRFLFFPEVVKKIAQNDSANFLEDVRFVISQLIRSKETPKIISKFEQEILPEMEKMHRSIIDRLDIDEILSDKFMEEEENPDWEEVFKDTPDFLDKIQEFSELQLEGFDVLITAFDRLKHFPFFKEPMNWFLPFYKNHPVISQFINMFPDPEKGKMFVEAVEKTFYMCDSDKYSFILNMDSMFPMQKQLVTELFTAEFNQLKELKDDEELTDPKDKNFDKIVQYIQDLYRFYHLSDFREPFDNIFEMETEIYNSLVFREYKFYDELLEMAAELYFEKKLYKEAAASFEVLIRDLHQETTTNYEKLAFSYEKMGDYDRAIENYTLAELFDSNKKWVYKRLGHCHMKKGDYAKALEFFGKLEEAMPDNLSLHALMGKCYLYMEDYENALKHYFKVEYHEPENVKILRAIAWAYFASGKLEDAENYYKKILKSSPKANDFMNYANVLFALGHKDKAFEYYSKALKKHKDLEKFLRDYEQDKKFLINAGVPLFDMELLRDAVILHYNDN